MQHVARPIGVTVNQDLLNCVTHDTFDLFAAVQYRQKGTTTQKLAESLYIE